ncbi:MAG TPA: lipopolysaccharide biosynthesis protein [Xanthobacteraceae bacterium]|nr:lipopolysaccharide biosynthesis protein [Xanthobacteraceae bacterium]
MRFDGEPGAMLERYGRNAILRSIFGQSVLALFYRCAGAIVTFAFSVLFARIMSIDEYGVLVSLLPFCFIAGIIGLLGQQTQLLRDIPKLRAQQNYQTITEIASRRLLLTLCGSLAMTVLAGCLFVAGRGRISIFNRPEYAVSLLLIVPLAVIELQNAIGCALGSVYLAIGPKEVLWRLAVAIAGLALFLVSQKPLSAGAVLGIAVLVLWLLVATQQMRVRQIIDWRPLFSLSAVFGRKTAVNFGASVPYWVTSVVNIALPSVDIVVVSIVIGPKAAAYYYAANRIALLLEFFISSFSVPAAPCIAWLHQAGHRAQISRMVSNAALVSCVAVSVGLTALGFAGDLVLRAFGPSFVQAHGLLMLLASGAIGSAYLGLGTPALEMTGHQAAASRIMAVTAFTGIIAMIVATTIFGVWGTAAIAILANLGRKAAIAIHIYAAEGIDITATSAIREQFTALRHKWAGRPATIEGGHNAKPVELQ